MFNKNILFLWTIKGLFRKLNVAPGSNEHINKVFMLLHQL